MARVPVSSMLVAGLLAVSAAATAVYVFVNPNGTHADGVGAAGLVVTVLALGVEFDRVRNRRGGRLAWAASLGLMLFALVVVALVAFAFTLTGD